MRRPAPSPRLSTGARKGDHGRVMVRRSLIFVWGNPPTPGARWRLGLFHFTRPPRNNRDIRRRLELGRHQLFRYHVLRVSLRGLLAWGAAMALAAYLAGAALVVRSLDARSPHNRVTYLDLVSPARWGGIDRLRGETMIADAKDALAAGRYSDGLGLMRAGLARTPENHDARLQIARFYVLAKLISPSIDILMEGLDHGYPGRDYLDTLQVLLEQSGRSAELPDLFNKARFARDHATTQPDDPTEARWLLERHAKALFSAGRHDEAATLVADLPDDDLFRRRADLAIAEAKSDHDRVSTLAKRWAAADPLAVEPRRALAVSARKRGDYSAMEDALALAQKADPLSLDVAIDAVVQQHLAGREPEAAAALDLLMFRHGGNPRLYSPAATAFAEVGFERGIDRVETQLTLHGAPALAAQWARFSVAEKNRDWTRLLSAADVIEETHSGRLTSRQKSWLNTARLLAQTCLDNDSGLRVRLTESLADDHLALSGYLRVLEPLLSANRLDVAKKILILAEGPYPKSPALADYRRRLEQAVAALPAPAEISAPDTIPDTFEGFQRGFAGALRSGDDAALAMLAAIRRSQPPWLSANPGRVDALELPFAVGQNDAPRVLVLVRSALRNAANTPTDLLAYAREIHPRRPRLAELILAEIVRHQPDHDETVAQLHIWIPEKRTRPAPDNPRHKPPNQLRYAAPDERGTPPSSRAGGLPESRRTIRASLTPNTPVTGMFPSRNKCRRSKK